MSKNPKQADHKKVKPRAKALEGLEDSLTAGSKREGLEKEGEARQKKGSYRKSAHLHHNQQSREIKKDPLIFDQLREDTKDVIASQGGQYEILADLNRQENFLIEAICQLLDSKSENHNPDSPAYYLGNGSLKTTNLEGTPLASLALSYYEITKVYQGADKLSGKQVEVVRQMLDRLKEKKFLITYKKVTKLGSKTITEKVEGYRSLLFIDQYTQETTDQEDSKTTSASKVIITLHPIFRDQIKTHFIPMPKDIIRRLRAAHEGGRPPNASKGLFDYLINEKANKRHTPEIGLEKLCHKLEPSFMERGQRSRARKSTLEAIERLSKDPLELIVSYEITQNKAGEDKVVFTLNPDFE